MSDYPMRIELFGGLKVHQGERTFQRFRTYHAGALLAYLACFPQQTPARDLLIEHLWPEGDPEVCRNRFRVCLAVLRKQLEPPGFEPGSILVADRTLVFLRPEAFVTDRMQFEAALQAARQASDAAESTLSLQRAVALYRGPLLAGYDDPWVQSERELLAQEYLETLRLLVKQLARARDFPQAVEYARLAVQTAPLFEEAHHDLIRLYIAAGQPSAALNQYRDLKHILLETMGAQPSPATRDLIRQLESSMGHGLPERAPQTPAQVSEPAPPVPATSPPPQPSESSPGSLPRLFTRFFGREREIAQILTLLPAGESADGEDPLLDTEPAHGCALTLTGPGGNGKTRLTLEVGRRLKERYAGRVWFVPLADLTDARLIPVAISDVLKLPRKPVADPMDLIAPIVQRLSERPSLLILDNFEQLIPEGVEIVRLLQQTPHLTLLIASRRTLGLEGEREYPIPPLETPEQGQDLAHLARVPSVALFVDRAQAIRPDFQITPRSAEAIASLCSRLEGIPLAIELAAARTRALTPAQIRERLEHRFELLVNPRAEKGARHGSLRSAIAWSYTLLTPALRRLFGNLSVFQGGWTLEAAQFVCAPSPRSEVLLGEEADDTAMLSWLEQLRECSLIQSEETPEGMRFRMLETIRAFAGELLAPADLAALRRRHALYYLQRVETAEPEFTGPNQTLWVERLHQDLDNIRAVLQGCLQTEIFGVDSDVSDASPLLTPVAIGLRICGAIWRVWTIYGLMEEGRRWTNALLDHPEAPARTLLRAKALTSAGILEQRLGDYAAARCRESESLSIRREMGHAAGIIASLSNLGTMAFEQGDLQEAQTLYEESLLRAREAQDRWRVAFGLSNLGNLYCVLGDLKSARAHHKEALSIRRELGDPRVLHSSLVNLSNIAFAEDDLQEAGSLLEQALVLAVELGDPGSLANTQGNLANVKTRLGETEEARRLLRQSLLNWQEIGQLYGTIYAFEGMFHLEQTLGNRERALLFSSAAHALRTRLGTPASRENEAERTAFLESTRAILGAEPFDRIVQQGNNLSVEEALTLALET